MTHPLYSEQRELTTMAEYLVYKTGGKSRKSIQGCFVTTSAKTEIEEICEQAKSFGVNSQKEFIDVIDCRKISFMPNAQSAIAFYTDYNTVNGVAMVLLVEPQTTKKEIKAAKDYLRGKYDIINIEVIRFMFEKNWYPKDPIRLSSMQTLARSTK